jgi:hypothetical protein
MSWMASGLTPSMHLQSLPPGRGIDVKASLQVPH